MTVGDWLGKIYLGVIYLFRDWVMVDVEAFRYYGSMGCPFVHLQLGGLRVWG